MTATSDLIIERRRVRRRLAFWRVLAIVALLAVAIVLIPFPSGRPASDHVARLTIEGIIFDDPERDEAILDLAENRHAKALIVRINSPGGTVAGSEALYESLRRVAARKPVVAVMGEAAASGGYVTALAAERIIARATTLTGSIGVVAEAPNFAGLLDKIGIDVLRVKSAPLKAEPSLLTPPEPGSVEAQQSLIDDSFAWFRDLVSERRGLTGQRLDAVDDGRAFTGRQALELGLVDAIGGEALARDWLEDSHGVSSDLALRDVEWGEETLPWPLSLDQGARTLETLERLAAPGARLFALIR